MASWPTMISRSVLDSVKGLRFAAVLIGRPCGPPLTLSALRPTRGSQQPHPRHHSPEPTTPGAWRSSTRPPIPGLRPGGQTTQPAHPLTAPSSTGMPFCVNTVADPRMHWDPAGVRSIFLFPLLSVDEATQVLCSLGQPNGSAQEWLVDGCLYVRLVDPPCWGDWEPDDARAVETCLGGSPGVMIEVDVSGRVPGRNEVYQLCVVLLREGGVASDDYSDCWSLSEILDSDRSGRRFFESQP